jgi:hypothetical protein
MNRGSICCSSALLATALSLLMIGCEGGGSDGAQSPVDTSSPAESWAWRLAVVADGQGYSSATAYSPGNAVVVCPFYRTTYGDNPPLDWRYGTGFETEIISFDRLPPPASYPDYDTPTQLVLLLSLTSDVTESYSNAMHFDHYACHAELREALTGRLVASADFAGDNVAPETAYGRPGDSISDLETMAPALIAWLPGYY